MRILLLEEDRVVRRDIMLALIKQGYDVELSPSANYYDCLIVGDIKCIHLISLFLKSCDCLFILNNRNAFESVKEHSDKPVYFSEKPLSIRCLRKQLTHNKSRLLTSKIPRPMIKNLLPIMVLLLVFPLGHTYLINTSPVTNCNSNFYGLLDLDENYSKRLTERSGIFCLFTLNNRQSSESDNEQPGVPVYSSVGYSGR